MKKILHVLLGICFVFSISLADSEQDMYDLMEVHDECDMDHDIESLSIACAILVSAFAIDAHMEDMDYVDLMYYTEIQNKIHNKNIKSPAYLEAITIVLSGFKDDPEMTDREAVRLCSIGSAGLRFFLDANKSRPKPLETYLLESRELCDKGNQYLDITKDVKLPDVKYKDKI